MNDGTTSDYFVDGVPQKKNAFDAKIKELVPEEMFRLLTSVSYFSSDMKWQDRRATLFDIAGTLTDKEIMASNEQFQDLLDSMGKLSLPEYKAKLLSQRKGLTGIRDDTPTRISECQKTLKSIQGIDFVEAREQEQALSDQQTELSRKLIAWENSNVLSDLQLKLREAKLERDTLESQNRVHRQNQSAGKPDTQAMAKTISSERMRLETLKTLTDGVRKEIDSYQKDIAAGREEWIRVNGEAFTGGICPTCGQALPFEQLQQATQSFDERKKQRLQGILEKGNQAKESCSIAQQRLKELETEIRDREGQIQALVEQLEAVKSSTVVVTDLPEYAEQMQAIQEKCSSLQAEIQRVMQDNAKEQNAIRAQLTAVNDQLRLVRGVIANESVKDQTMDRIAQLKADAKNAAKALEAIEKMLRQMEEFTRFKARFVEDGINSLFCLATFRLFRVQTNGGLEERCDVVYKGVPYMGLNNGAKINVGIDIINTLSRHYGVTVPLFVDNAEAVTRLLDCDAQVIRLVVSEEDKELRVV